MYDSRKGRPTQTRALLAQSLIDACVETFELDVLSMKVEFTQHDGDEMCHPHLGGFNTNWRGDETGTLHRDDRCVTSRRLDVVGQRIRCRLGCSPVERLVQQCAQIAELNENTPCGALPGEDDACALEMVGT